MIEAAQRLDIKLWSVFKLKEDKWLPLQASTRGANALRIDICFLYDAARVCFSVKVMILRHIDLVAEALGSFSGIDERIYLANLLNHL